MEDSDGAAEHRTDQLWIQLSQAPIDVQDADEFLRVPECGSINLFVGTPRSVTEKGGDDRETVRLEYEAYVPMALNLLTRMGEDALHQYDVRRVAILHRLGPVSVDASSVLVGVSTPHREEGFVATQRLIDALKQQVPVWKKEVYADGTTEWVQGTAPPSVAPTRHTSTAQSS